MPEFLGASIVATQTGACQLCHFFPPISVRARRSGAGVPSQVLPVLHRFEGGISFHLNSFLMQAWSRSASTARAVLPFKKIFILLFSYSMQAWCRSSFASTGAAVAATAGSARPAGPPSSTGGSASRRLRRGRDPLARPCRSVEGVRRAFCCLWHSPGQHPRRGVAAGCAGCRAVWGSEWVVWRGRVATNKGVCVRKPICPHHPVAMGASSAAEWLAEPAAQDLHGQRARLAGVVHGAQHSTTARPFLL